MRVGFMDQGAMVPLEGMRDRMRTALAKRTMTAAIASAVLHDCLFQMFRDYLEPSDFISLKMVAKRERNRARNRRQRCARKLERLNRKH